MILMGTQWDQIRNAQYLAFLLTWGKCLLTFQVIAHRANAQKQDVTDQNPDS